MSEPFWTPLGGQPVDWEGAWAAGTQYAPGDVVTYNGVTYLAVNPSLGSTPPANLAIPFIGTSLPVAPADGTEFVLVDSLTAPTYQWRLRYLAAKASNKWLFLGGSAIFAEVLAQEARGGGYGDLATLGPSITLPVAGDYLVEQGFDGSTSGGAAWARMSYAIGATAAVDADAAVSAVGAASGTTPNGFRQRHKLGLGAVTLLAKYGTSGASITFENRWMRVTPLAVGG